MNKRVRLATGLIIVVLALLGLGGGPLFAQTASSFDNESSIQTYVPANPPLVYCKWEGPDDADPDHSIPDTQVLPSAEFETDKTVEFYAVLTDPDGVDTIDRAYADVFRPADSPGGGTLKSRVDMSALDQVTAIAVFDSAVSQGLITFAAGLDAAQVRDELTGGIARVWAGTSSFRYNDAFGDYRVAVKACDQDDYVSNSLTNSFRYVPVAACEFDFSAVSYGTVNPGDGNWAWVIGDYDFNTPGAPTARNIGNTNLEITVNQDDMGFGSNGDQPNVYYDAGFGDVSHGGYGPQQTITLPGVLLIGETERLSFSIQVDNAAPGDYAGQMSLVSLYSPFIPGQEEPGDGDEPAEVPALSSWGMAGLTAVLLVSIIWLARRKQKST